MLCRLFCWLVSWLPSAPKSAPRLPTGNRCQVRITFASGEQRLLTETNCNDGLPTYENADGDRWETTEKGFTFWLHDCEPDQHHKITFELLKCACCRQRDAGVC